MKILLALDSRPGNAAAIGLLDPHTGRWDRFQVVEVAEPFKRKGYRGAALVGDQLYVVNSAALYQLALDRDHRDGPLVRPVRTLRRPEWALGQRSAGDLHHVHHSATRERLFVASSFLDAVDEVTLDLRFVRRHYLWDVSPAIAAEALRRNPYAVDLVHCNHICEHDGRLYVTCGNWNRTRMGKVICFDTGEVVLDGLQFPHDGFVHDGDFYLSETEAQRVLVYRGFSGDLRGRPGPDRVLPVTIDTPGWEGSFQWVRGIAVTKQHIIAGVTQWRDDAFDEPQIPPRLAFFDRASGEHRGDLFLPEVEGFATPSLFSVHIIEDERPESFDLDAWRAGAPPPRTGGTAPARVVESLPLAFTDESGELSAEWSYAAAPAGQWWVSPADEGGVVVTSSMNADDKFYLRTGRDQFDVPPARPDVWTLAPGRPHELHARATEYEGNIQVKLWVFEYCGGRRAGHHVEKLKGGTGVVRFQIAPDTTSVRIGLRFSGAGRVALAPLRLLAR